MSYTPSSSFLGINNQVANYTITALDSDKILVFDSAIDVTLSMDTGILTGFHCWVIQKGVGKVIFDAGAATLNIRNSLDRTAGQYAIGYILSDEPDVFEIGGDLADSLGNNNNTNIYNSDGIVTNNRTIDVNGKILEFNEDIYINGAKIGVGGGNITASNTVLGSNVLRVNTTGFENTVMGFEAMYNNTIGFKNTAIGYKTLRAGISGDSNVAIGAAALSNNVADFNTAVGNEALLANTLGVQNTAIGYQAMLNNTGGNFNLMVGVAAGNNNTVGDFNTGLGYGAVYNTTDGDDNVGVGHNALSTNTMGVKNTAVGAFANVTSNSLVNATAIGANSTVSVSNALVLGSINGVNGATSDIKVGIGKSAPSERLDITGNLRLSGAFMPNNLPGTAGFLLQSGGAGVAPTWISAASIGSGFWSILGNSATTDGTNFIGTTDNKPFNFRINNQKAGRIGTANEFNTFLGYQAGNVNNFVIAVSGHDNTAIGQFALKLNTTGDTNTAIGSTALSNNNIGRHNAGFAYGALQANLTGNFNTAIGGAALSVNTIGSQNTGLGYLANVATNALINATAIGANSQVNASNSLVLGSINGTNGAVADTKVGIGITTPDTRLHVVGQFKLVDGTQALNKVLTSDATGVASWQDPSLIPDNDWSLIGNAGTIAGTNFIGTTDNNDLIFKVNGVFAGRLVSTGANTIFGKSAMPLSGGFINGNSAFGNSALANNTAGNNTAVGVESLFHNTSGTNNTAIGYQNSQNITFGFQNTSIGTSALSTLVSGNYNSSIGYLSDVGSSSISNATAIGSFSRVDASNSLVLGSIDGVNGATADTKVGIGVTAPSERLHVNGNLRLSAAFMPNNLAGTSGQLLSSAGVGVAPTWVNASSLTPLTNTQIAYGSTGNTVTSVSDFTYNVTGINKLFNVGFAGSSSLRLDKGTLGGSYSMGELSNTHNNSHILVDDPNKSFSFLSGGDLFLGIDVNNKTYSLGDLTANSNSTFLTVDDQQQRLVLGSGGVNQITVDVVNNTTRFGPLAGTMKFGFNKTASEVLDVQGNVRFSGALMPNGQAGSNGYILKSNGLLSSPTWIDPTTLVTAGQKFGKDDITFAENRTVTGSDIWGLQINNLALFNLNVYNGSIGSTRIYADDATTEFYSPQGSTSIQLADSPNISLNSSSVTINGISPYLNFYDQNDDNTGIIATNSSGVEHSRFDFESNGDYTVLTSSKYPSPGATVCYWDMNTKNLVNTGTISAANNFNSNTTPHVLSTTTGINAKTVGTTNLYTVPVGKTAIITETIIRVTTITAITVAPTLGLGIAAGEDDIYTPQILTGLNSTSKIYRFSSGGVYTSGSAGNIIKLGIDTGATGTTMTISIDLIGYLI